jgi:glucose 1-dehydrogenase
VGRSRELRGVERRRDAHDEKHRAGSRPVSIRVNSIAPGAIRTPIKMQAGGTPEHYAELLKLIPYKRIGEAEEIGRAAVWLASDDSDYVHGVTLFVDGGMTLCPGFETGG